MNSIRSFPRRTTTGTAGAFSPAEAAVHSRAERTSVPSIRTMTSPGRIPARWAAVPRRTRSTLAPSVASATSTPTTRSPRPTVTSNAGRASVHARHACSTSAMGAPQAASIARAPVRSSWNPSTYARYHRRSLPVSARYSMNDRATG